MSPWPRRPYSPPLTVATTSNPPPKPDNNKRALPRTPASNVVLEIPSLHSRRTPAPEAPPVKHGRSFSHPFPSLFGGSSKRAERRGLGRSRGILESTEDDESVRELRSSQSSNVPSRNASLNAKSETTTGKCMTCDSTVRWPRELKVFRCTVCLTVNDLEPYSDQVLHSPSAQQSNTNDFTPKTGKHPPERLLAKFMGDISSHNIEIPLSLERTRAMIDHCLQIYLDSRRPHTSRSREYQPRPTSGPATGPDVDRNYVKPSSRMDTRKNSESAISSRPVLNTMRSNPLLNEQNPFSSSPRLQNPLEPPRRRLDQSDVSDDEAPSKPRTRDAIFRPVETYIASCLTDCATLNRAFLSVRPDFLRAASEGTSSATVTDKSFVSSPVIGTPSFGVEVDAKTLLLGDIAENGSWWTGERSAQGQPARVNSHPRSPDFWQGTVNLKSPRVNWTGVASWYRTVLHAGDNWRERWKDIESDSPSSVTVSPLDRTPELFWEIENDLAESRNHLQRVLLKATENLLKRPRRPLKHPEDCRFLLIILANPLLGSSLVAQPSRRPSSQAPGRRAGPGQHSGIIKRTLGLLGQLPNEIHQYLVSWISRFSEGQFQRLVDLVGGFVTYRLGRPAQTREIINPTEGLVPSFSDGGVHHASQLHAALGGSRSQSSKPAIANGKPQVANYGEDWQIRAAARVMSLLFAANVGHSLKKREAVPSESRSHSTGLTARYRAHSHGQLIPISSFYNTMLDYADLAADFDSWESSKGRFSFCQYPFFFSIYAKIHLMELEARRQMEIKAREAFFDSILTNKAVSQFWVLKVRRDCLVDDSLRRISEVVGSAQEEIKKGLKIDFVGEEGVDAGGIRKEWFLLLIREVFDEAYGLFVYDEDSRFCYFNPHCFESSEKYFLVGVVTGLAIYNSTILDIAFPPFVFKKLLSSTPTTGNVATSLPRIAGGCTLEDLGELRPTLARGLRQFLEYEGDVQKAFCRDFAIEEDRYGEIVTVPLCPGGERMPVTNSNRRDFVELYLHHLLDTSVSRQYEPFKRGFFTVCGGNALSLFRPQEIELLIRGSDEPLDISSLRAVAVYEGPSQNTGRPTNQSNIQCPQIQWFWETFESASPAHQRKLLGFITGSDRIPAMGATNLVIKIQLLQNDGKWSREGGIEVERFPTARTCFNTLVLHPYRTKEQLERKLWVAVEESEGFGLK